MRGISAALILAVATLGGVSSASAQFRIAEDRGGQIGPYLQQFAMVRDSGSRVIIDGTCLSACTLVLGTVPKDRICVTSRANLGFHAAWNLAPGGRTVYSAEGTRLLWEIYPTQIRNWINRHGGLKRQMIYLRGKELASMYATCDSPTQVAGSGSNVGRTRSADGTLFARARKPM
ncbi:MAG TPA: hypothetical protein VFK79_09950 [Xanthobacteraceae bacterium]|nr:hypothetical protein [Xanthobacteraceae bacterium]